MSAETFTIRPAGPGDDPEIAALVVEGFLDKFRPVFGPRMENSVKIMEKWVRLEHTLGGVRSLVIEAGEGLAASVGVRTEGSDEEALARGLWRVLRRNLGFLRATWATVLLSYPTYAARPREAYVERLVVAPEFRNRGLARGLLSAAEELGVERDKETIGLHVGGTNVPAMRLYESEGYAEVSRQRSLLTNRFLNVRDWIYLQKRL